MAFNTAYLTKSRFGSKDYTKGFDEIKISMKIDWTDGIDRGELNIPSHYWTKETDTNDKDLYQFEFRPHFGFHLRPFKEYREGFLGAMDNGIIAEVNSMLIRQLQKMVGYPISEYMPVHDRYETPEQYRQMSTYFRVRFY